MLSENTTPEPEDKPADLAKVRTMREDIARLRERGDVSLSIQSIEPPEAPEERVREISKEASEEDSSGASALSSTKEIEEAIQAIAPEWEALKKQKEELAISIQRIQNKELVAVLDRERLAEEQNHNRERQKESVSDSERQEFMKQQWEVEDARRAVERERWEVEDRIYEIQKELDKVEDRLKEISEQEQMLQWQREHQKDKEDRKALEDRLKKEERRLQDVQEKKVEQEKIVQEKQKEQEKITESFKKAKEKENALNLEIDAIEKQEQEAIGSQQSREIEQTRWEREQERRAHQQEAWDQQSKKRRVDKEVEKILARFQTTVDQENEIQERARILQDREKEPLSPSSHDIKKFSIPLWVKYVALGAVIVLVLVVFFLSFRSVWIKI
ncbi:MAG: hypothetical protein Q8P70_01520 [bacterium]|nr:hypothetical protein [bacterium]